MLKLFVFIFSLYSICSLSTQSPHQDEIRAHWNSHKVKYGLHRLNEREEEVRFNIFKENFVLVKEHRSDDFNISLNKFAHLSHEEFMKERMGLKGFLRSNETEPEDEQILQASRTILQATDALPENFNWYSKNVLTPVKDQLSCGSCWSFVTTGVVEALYAIKYNNIKRFSEQQLIDCTYKAKSYINYGCDGGWPENGLAYAKLRGLVEEASYPYKATERTCFGYTSVNKPRYRISSHFNLPEGNENALKKAVYQYGPIAVGVDATPRTFEFYSGGIYNDPRCDPNDLTHAMLLVGYGTENGQDYWLLKNSWGTSWGLNGYMKLARNRNNRCGIASMATAGIL